MDWSRLPADLETYFLEFYREIVRAETAPGCIPANKNCLRKVRNAFHKKTLRAGNSNTRFDLPGMRGAYVFQYGTVFSSAVAFHFMRLLRRNPVYLHRLLSQDTVVICCLGGGPGTELLAIATIVDHVMSRCPFESWRLRNIHVYLIDVDGGWSATAGHVVRNLNDWSRTRLQFGLEFIRADLAEPLTPEVCRALRMADIVTAVKFISAIYSMKGEVNITEMLQRIVRLMSDGSLMFYLDSSVSDYFRVFRNSMASLGSMGEIYGPLEISVHRLSEFTVRRSRGLFSEIYGGRCSADSTNNDVSSWCKGVYRHAACQDPAASASEWTTNQWNGTHSNYHASDPRVEQYMLPSYPCWNSCNNYDRDAGPPRKKRRNF